MTSVAEVEDRIVTRFGIVPGRNCCGKTKEAVEELSRREGTPIEEVVQRALMSPGLLRELAGSLTVPESFFFRHRERYEQIVETLGKPSKHSGSTRRKIWSAGCSSGEEPYSLAILLLERLRDLEFRNIEIDATDINRQAVEKAQSGLFKPWSFRSMEHRWKEKYFDPSQEQYRIRQDVRQMIKFHHLSIQEQLCLFGQHSVDVILFCNVAIYLNKATINHLYESFQRVLCHDGLLLVSATDPRPPDELFRPVSGTSLYRAGKRKAQTTSPMMPDNSTKPKETSTFLNAGNPSNSLRMIHTPKGSSDACENVTDCSIRGIDTEKMLRNARDLADEGRYEPALEIVCQILQMDSTIQQAYVLRGQLHLARAQEGLAIEDLRRALFLNPMDDFARFLFAVSLRNANSTKRALNETKALIRRLNARQIESEVLTDDATVGDLLLAASRLKESLE